MAGRLQGGTPIEIALETDDPTLSLTLAIIAPDGTLLTAVPGGDMPSLYMPQYRRYTLQVYALQAAASGTYRIRSRSLSASLTPTFSSAVN
jgi:hypothetical protein